MAIGTLPGQVFDFSINDSSFVGMLQKINSFTDVGQGGMIGIMIMIITGGGLLLMMRSFGNERAFPVALFVAGLVGVFLRILVLIGDQVFWISIALLIIGILLLVREQANFEQ